MEWLGYDSITGADYGEAIRKGLEPGANVVGVAPILGGGLDFHLDYYTGDRGCIGFAFRCQPPFTKIFSVSSAGCHLDQPTVASIQFRSRSRRRVFAVPQRNPNRTVPDLGLELGNVVAKYPFERPHKFSRNPAEFWPQRLFAFELPGWGDAARA
jgi:hypothetical protein